MGEQGRGGSEVPNVRQVEKILNDSRTMVPGFAWDNCGCLRIGRC